MKKTQNNHRNKEQEKPARKVRLEVYDDGLYVGTINTDITVKEGDAIEEETLSEYVREKMPSYRKKKHLTVRIA